MHPNRPFLLAAVALVAGMAPAWAGTAELVSVSSSGAPADRSSGDPSISADGRFVAFRSADNNLAPGGTNGDTCSPIFPDCRGDIFVRDRQLGTTERVGFHTSASNRESFNGPSISADGQLVSFGISTVQNPEIANVFFLAPDDPPGLYVRDRRLGTTEQVSPDAFGAVSANGRFFAFVRTPPQLFRRPTGVADVFVRDRQLGTTERVSVGPDGKAADGISHSPSISADGRFVAFGSFAANLVPGDTNHASDVFVRDRQLGTTERVSVGPDGAQAEGGEFFGSYVPSISADGRFVAFESFATNLVPGVTERGIFVRDRKIGTTEFVGPGDEVSISADGRFVAFRSSATNLVPGVTEPGTFVRDRKMGTTEFVGPGDEASISANGRFVALRVTSNSPQTSNCPGLSGFKTCVFVHDRGPADN
jgi:Tol biopolymer transport system component